MPVTRHTTSRLAAIICNHCGRDYAREYWAMGTTADPNVCKSCRRDLNRDAADAPIGGPPVTVADPPREMIVSQAQKQCRMCGGRWDGLIFGPPPVKGSPPPFGICPTCGEREDSLLVKMSAHTVPVGVPLELARPRRVADD